MKKIALGAAAIALVSTSLLAQETAAPVSSQEQPANSATAQTAVLAPAPTPLTRVLPVGTILVVTPMQEISSKRVEVGDKFQFQVVTDVVEGGTIVIPRGTPVMGEVVWKTGRAIGGKSGKFEIEFRTASVNGREVVLTGKHRQEGRGNTVGALLGSIFITGRSAVMIQGQLVNAITKEPFTY